MGSRQDYRQVIYDKYASCFKGSSTRLDVRAARRWGKAYDYYFRKWLPKRKDATILDMGCGAGQLLLFFKQRGYTNLSGVDISPEQVGLARQVTPDIAERDIFEFLEAHSDSFDLITGLDIIEHFHKDEILRFLEGCYAALKPGGRIILQTPNAASPWALLVRYGDLTHEVCLAPSLLMDLLSMIGFEKSAVREACPPSWGYSLSASVRYLIWQGIRVTLMLESIVETGGAGNGVFARVFLATGMKK